jgi:hypothetical protein
MQGIGTIVVLLGMLGSGAVPAQSPAFAVTGTTPAHAALDVDIEANIIVDLDADVDPLTVSTATFVVSGQLFGLVPGIFTFPTPDRIVFDPGQDFLGGERIDVTLSCGILSASGAPLTPHHFTFVVATTSPCWVPFRFIPGGSPGFGKSAGDVTLGDVDGDGDLDAYVTGSYPLGPGPERDLLLINDGSGVFLDSGQSLPIGRPPCTGTLLGDVDRDGDLDAVLVGYGEPSAVWVNDGTGQLTDSGQRIGSGVYLPWDLDLGDLDGDGDLDALMGTQDGGEVWFNSGAGVFLRAGRFFGPAECRRVRLADLDGDGNLDAILGQVGITAIWLSDGTGTFVDSGHTLPGADVFTVDNFEVGDVDGDGDLDVILAPFQIEAPPCELWLNDGHASFSESAEFVGDPGVLPVMGDVDGDGDLDLLVYRNHADLYADGTVLLNDGHGNFAESGQVIEWGEYELGDVDGDGDLDAFRGVAPTYDGATEAYVWLNDCAPPCAITSPASTEPVGGEVAVSFDVVAPPGAPVTATFEYSLDGGATWLPCTPGVGHTIPADPVSPPAAGVLFLWDSLADGVGMTRLEVVELRITITDGVQAGGCAVSPFVDNTTGSVDEVAIADLQTERGSVVGSYLDTHVQDGIHEELIEGDSGGKPSNRYSLLGHTWQLQVAAGIRYTFLVDAYCTAFEEAEDFRFSYSLDNQTFTPMLTVTDTIENDVLQGYIFPESVAGTLYVKVEDMNRSSRPAVLDTVFVDAMWVRVSPGSGDLTPPAPPTGLVATPGSGQVALDWTDSPELDLDGYNVYRSNVSGAFYSMLNATPVAASDYVDTSVMNGSTYYYVVTAVDTSANESADSAEVSATPQGGGAVSSLHVASITLAKVSAGPGVKTGWATVVIEDDLGGPVAGALVTGTFGGDLTDTVAATTDGAGVAVLMSAQTGGGGLSFSFCVDDVVHATLPYNPGANLETCDSY